MVFLSMILSAIFGEKKPPDKNGPKNTMCAMGKPRYSHMAIQEVSCQVDNIEGATCSRTYMVYIRGRKILDQ
jgi:hypothetical protein